VQSWGRSLNGHHTILDLHGHGLEYHQDSLLELGIENRGSCRLKLRAEGCWGQGRWCRQCCGVSLLWQVRRDIVRVFVHDRG